MDKVFASIALPCSKIRLGSVNLTGVKDRKAIASSSISAWILPFYVKANLPL
jgi:hypothetical protein